MFRVEDVRPEATNLVYTHFDPRDDGYLGPVDENVELDNDESVNHWPIGSARPDIWIGRDPADPNHDVVFKYRRDLDKKGFHPIPGNLVLATRWTDYLKNHYPEDLPEDKWFQELDRLDAASRKRRQLMPKHEPVGNSRDQVAESVARNHMLVDHGVREVWYLPEQCPPDEIRLLELNDRIELPESKIEPVDFGLDLGGANFRLCIADVNSEQLQKIMLSPACLPSGWSLEGNHVWRRGA